MYIWKEQEGHCNSHEQSNVERKLSVLERQVVQLRTQGGSWLISTGNL
jgi:hypothetical protein